MPDARIQSAIQNWAPRFLANGIDYNDFVRVVSEVESWPEWCGAWRRVGDRHRELGEEATAEERYLSAAAHYFQASMAYHFGKFLFVEYPQERQQTSALAVESYQKASRLWPGAMELLRIPGPDGISVPAVLRKPDHAARPPVVILVPGLDSVKEELHRYGDDFLARGMAVLAIDGPGQGELEDVAPMRPDYEAVVSRVLDFIESREDLEGRRVGIMGVSVGGYYAARAAAHDRRIRAAIESGGEYCLADHFESLPELTKTAMRYRTGCIEEDETRRYLARFTLEGQLSGVACPFLIIHGECDRLFPVEVAQRIFEEARPFSQLWVVPGGNHLCNNLPYVVRPKQADWMARALSGQMLDKGGNA
ncbi:MAG: alpha/beta hydrolase [Firmicutes bacterium]|nr:alpha/beta hydrolase [Bacillota bacterium]